MSSTTRWTVRRAVVLFAVAWFAVAATVAGCSSDEEKASPTTGDRASTTTVPAPAASTVAGLLALGRPVILAHAGGEDAHPHSVPYSYARSVAGGVDLLDFDVQLTKDGVLVVQHDDTVDRTTNGTGKVADMTYAELSKLDNAYWWTEKCTCKDQPEDAYTLRGIRTGERPPPEGFTPDDFAIARFEDIAAKYRNYVVNVEIKGTMPDALPAAKELARLLREQGREDSAVVTAFDDPLAEAFHELLPEVAITPGLQATTAYVLSGAKPADGRRILQVPPDYEGIQVLTPDLVTRAHDDGLYLWIWPNERKWENADGYRQLLDLGVDGINAAQPEIAVSTLQEWEKSRR